MPSQMGLCCGRPQAWRDMELNRPNAQLYLILMNRHDGCQGTMPMVEEEVMAKKDLYRCRLSMANDSLG